MKAANLKRSIFMIAFALGFLAYELWTLAQMSDQIWMEDQVTIFISEPGEILVVGDNPWFEDMVTGNAGSLLNLPRIHHWEDLEVGNYYQWAGLSVSKVDESLGLVDLGSDRFLILLDEVEDWESLLSQELDFEAHSWLLWKNLKLDNIPPPSHSIFVLNKKIRAPKIWDLAKEKGLPLIWTKETGEVFLEKKEHWEIKTAN